MAKAKEFSELPAGLQEKFRQLERRLLAVESASAVFVVLVSALAAFLLFYGVERFIDSPKSLRALFACAALIAIAIAAWRWAVRWIIARRGFAQLAILVQRKHRRLGDRLLGIVELASESNRPAYFSPELYAAAINQVAQEAEPIDFTTAVNLKALRSAGALAILLSVVAAVVVLASPDVANNSLARLAMPGAQIARRTLVEIQPTLPEMVVARGERFEVPARVVYHSFWHPSRLNAAFSGMPATSTNITGTTPVIRVPAQVSDGVLKFTLGDGTAQVVVQPMDRPTLRSVDANINYPEYLQYPPAQERVSSGVLNIVEGSSITLSATAVRPIAQAQMREGDKTVPLHLTNTIFESPSLAIEGTREIAFTWADTFGLTNASPFSLNVQSTPDAAPVADFSDLLRDVAILETEVLQLKVAANDDFGIKEFGVVMDAPGSLISNLAPLQASSPDPKNKRLEQSFVFTPAVAGVTRDATVELRAWAIDYFPGRTRSESPVYRIHILGVEQHAEMLRQRMESLLAQLDEVSRLEEKIAAATRELQDSTKPGSEKDTKQLQEAKEQQQQNAQTLKEMAEEGTKALREATRNPAFTPEMIMEWSKTLHQMEELSKNEMQEAAKDLQAAQQSDSKQPQQSPQQQAQKREQKLADAKQKEDDAIKKLQELQKDVNKELDDMQALTLAQRLRQLGTDETAIATDIEKHVADTIGLPPHDLPPRLKEVNTELAGKQNGAGERATGLQSEISRFFERTGKTNYAHVSKAMLDSRASDELDRVRAMIGENIAMDASQQLEVWSKKMQEWADILEPKSQDDKSQSAGESGPSQPDMALKQLVALLRMREAQSNLRERTRLTEENKKQTTYKSATEKLHEGQNTLHQQVERMEKENPFKELAKPFAEVEEEMGFASTLLKQPRTDAKTVEVESNAIGQLTDAINILNEQAKKNPSSSPSSGSSAQQMSFLMQMMQQQQAMAMAPNPMGAPNMNGGGTDQIPAASRGAANGRADENRTGSKATGVSTSVPSEFREALQEYYKALEREGSAK